MPTWPSSGYEIVNVLVTDIIPRRQSKIRHERHQRRSARTGRPPTPVVKPKNSGSQKKLRPKRKAKRSRDRASPISEKPSSKGCSSQSKCFKKAWKALPQKKLCSW